jgi:hypothetical protein
MPRVVDLDAAFQVPRLCKDGAGGLGPAQRVERPADIPPEAQHYLNHRRYMVDKRYYGFHPGATSAPPPVATTVDPLDPNCYLLREVEDLQIGNLLFFTRTFGNIPLPWVEPGSSNVALPGLQDPETLASAKTITACSANNYGDVQTLTSNDHGYSAGDRVLINLRLEANITGKNNDVLYSFNAYYPVLAATTNTFDVALGPIVGHSTTILGPASAYKLSGYPLRLPRNRFVPTAIEHAYFLPGVSPGIEAVEDIPLLQAFTTNRGSESADWPENTLSDATVPTAAEYWALMQSRTRLILDCTLAVRLGPLIDRRTVKYAAQ